MKKFMLLATAVGMTLTSCVNDEEATMMDTRSVIAFDAPALKTSRANVLGEISGVKYPTTENFKVFCKIYSGNYKGWTTSEGIVDYFKVAGDEAKHEGGTYWSTETVYYWPDAGYNLAFAAYSPAVLGDACKAADGFEGTKITRTAAGIQITDFVSEESSDHQYDLMYSHTVYDRNKSNNASSAVSLQFEHALSSIVFSSQKSDANVDYEIIDLVVGGDFHVKGNFTQGITSTTNGAGDYTETENPVWDLQGRTATPVNYDPTFTAFDVPDASPEIFTQGSSAILAIPQPVPANATVTVTYTKTSNGTTTTHTAAIKLLDFKKAAVDASAVAEGITTWERGKRYVYRIAFGENKRIYFEPSITDWVQEPTLIYTIN